jgi:hypothetical protein
MSSERTNYFAWAMAVMLAITTASMLEAWLTTAMSRQQAGPENSQGAPRAYTYMRLKVPPPGTPIQSSDSSPEQNEQARRANDATAATLQKQCWDTAGGDMQRQSKDQSCLDYHAYVNFGIMPLPAIKSAKLL